MYNYLFVAAVLVCVASKKIQTLEEEEADGDVPPPPEHNGLHAMNQLVRNSIGTRSHWPMNDKQNVWELSGLLEGDIMEDELTTRNALVYENLRWPGAVVPYHIGNQFNQWDRQIIHGSMQEIQLKSCVRFRPYTKSDRDYIIIGRNTPGCWSFHGRTGGGQVVNLDFHCVKHGVVIHELLHALGLVHQQVVPDRDNFVRILWDNIIPREKHNFKMRPAYEITNYGLSYDYGSIMHYSAYAFSMNGQPTVIPLMSGARIGQNNGLSEYDVIKIRRMYNCQ